MHPFCRFCFSEANKVISLEDLGARWKSWALLNIGVEINFCPGYSTSICWACVTTFQCWASMLKGKASCTGDETLAEQDSWWEYFPSRENVFNPQGMVDEPADLEEDPPVRLEQAPPTLNTKISIQHFEASDQDQELPIIEAIHTSVDIKSCSVPLTRLTADFIKRCSQGMVDLKNLPKITLDHSLKCSKCNLLLTSRAEVKEHHALLHPDNSLCPYCAEIFRADANLIKHILEKTCRSVGENEESMTFVCPKCPETSMEFSLLATHFSSTHSLGQLAATPKSCWKCCHVYFEQKQLKDHVKHAHSQVQCKRCRQMFKNQVAMMNHFSQSHKRVKFSSCAFKGADGQGHDCIVCDTKFPDEPRAAKHFLTYHAHLLSLIENPNNLVVLSEQVQERPKLFDSDNDDTDNPLHDVKLLRSGDATWNLAKTGIVPTSKVLHESVPGETYPVFNKVFNQKSKPRKKLDVHENALKQATVKEEQIETSTFERLLDKPNDLMVKLGKGHSQLEPFVVEDKSVSVPALRITGSAVSPKHVLETRSAPSSKALHNLNPVESCPECNKQFYFKSKLKKHMLYHKKSRKQLNSATVEKKLDASPLANRASSKVADNLAPSNLTNTEKVLPTLEPGENCPVCNKFFFKSKLQKHLQAHKTSQEQLKNASAEKELDVSPRQNLVPIKVADNCVPSNLTNSEELLPTLFVGTATLNDPLAKSLLDNESQKEQSSLASTVKLKSPNNKKRARPKSKDKPQVAKSLKLESLDKLEETFNIKVPLCRYCPAPHLLSSMSALRRHVRTKLPLVFECDHCIKRLLKGEMCPRHQQSQSAKACSSQINTQLLSSRPSSEKLHCAAPNSLEAGRAKENNLDAHSDSSQSLEPKQSDVPEDTQRAKVALVKQTKPCQQGDDELSRVNCPGCSLWFKNHEFKDHVAVCEKTNAYEKSAVEKIESLDSVSLILYFCKWCPSCFKNRDEFHAHVGRRHPTVKLFICSDCGLPCDKKYMPESHKNAICTYSQEYKCHVCGKTFLTSTILKEHTDLIHPNSSPIPKKKSRKKVSSESQPLLVLRPPETSTSKECGEPECNSGPLPLDLDNILANASKAKYECLICGLLYISLIHLEMHMVSTHPDVHMYSCNLCPDEKRFQMQSHLKAHVALKHSSNPYIQEKSCVSKAMQTVSSNQVPDALPVEELPKTQTLPESPIERTRKPVNIAPKCSAHLVMFTSGSKTASPASVIIDMGNIQKDVEDQPAETDSVVRRRRCGVEDTSGSCDLCGFTYVNSEQQREHVSRAHGRKSAPLPCMLCNKVFASMTVLKMHVATCKGAPKPKKHESPSKAEIDQSDEELRFHLDEEEESNPEKKLVEDKVPSLQPFNEELLDDCFCCNECSVAFATKSAYLYHMRNRHR